MQAVYIYGFVVAKLLIGFIIILTYFNLSGKKRLSELMTPISFIGNILLGTVLSSCLDPQKSFLVYILNFALVIFVIVITEYLSTRISAVRERTVGHPIPIIRNHKLLLDNINNPKYKIDLANIAETLKIKGYPFVHEVYYAQLETDGTITTIDQRSKIPGLLVVCKGEIREYELQEIGKNAKWLKHRLSHLKVKLKDVYLAEYQRYLVVTLLNGTIIKDVKENK